MGLYKVNQDDVYNIVKNIFLCPLFITFPRPPTPILAQDWGMYSALCRSVALAAFRKHQGYSEATGGIHQWGCLQILQGFWKIYEDIWRYICICITVIMCFTTWRKIQNKNGLGKIIVPNGKCNFQVECYFSGRVYMCWNLTWTSPHQMPTWNPLPFPFRRGKHLPNTPFHAVSPGPLEMCHATAHGFHGS